LYPLQLGGVFRSSISLVVIMVEGTGGISFVFCIIGAVLVSNTVSSWFTHHGGGFSLDVEFARLRESQSNAFGASPSHPLHP
jgi:H+/Cl- antiporter ClcA